MVDRPTDVSKEKAKIDRTSQTLQALLSEKGDSQALDNWVQKDPKIFERLFDMVMVYKVSTRRIGFKAYNKNNKELRFRETIRNQFNPKMVMRSWSATPIRSHLRITKLIRRPAESYYPNTVTFDRGVVEVNADNELIVKRNVSGKNFESMVNYLSTSSQLKPIISTMVVSCGCVGMLIRMVNGKMKISR